MRAPAIAALLGFLAAPSYAQEVPRRVPAQLFVLGGADPPPETAFPREPVLLVDRAGRLYLRVPGRAGIRVFDQEGGYLRSVARSGEGPGEFQSVGDFGFVGDTLWARNWPTPRISLFTLDGEHLRTDRSDLSHGRPFSSPQSVTGLLADGRAYATPQGNPLGVEERIEVPVLIGDRSMTDADTLFSRPLPTGMYVPRVGSWSYAPFPKPPFFEVFPDGTGVLVVRWDDSEPGVVRLTRFDPGGNPVLRQELVFEPREVPPEAIREVVAEGMRKAAAPVEAARRRGASVSNDLESMVRRALDVPEYYPPVQDVAAGADGSIWLRPTGQADVNRWVVLGPEGSRLYEVELPAGVRVQQATVNRAWATRTDDLDVPYVVGYALRIR